MLMLERFSPELFCKVEYAAGCQINVLVVAHFLFIPSSLEEQHFSTLKIQPEQSIARDNFGRIGQFWKECFEHMLLHGLKIAVKAILKLCKIVGPV